ncbi:hypothetical protein [Pelagibacterium lacus]|uniref:hypothetical protein n=1 Tax=Pelagibacterium lacus TaxID=2282655 RepID=UPI001314059F|nr:hypothetical protein [Pelagibacterium lacus]
MAKHFHALAAVVAILALAACSSTSENVVFDAPPEPGQTTFTGPNDGPPEPGQTTMQGGDDAIPEPGQTIFE